MLNQKLQIYKCKIYDCICKQRIPRAIYQFAERKNRHCINRFNFDTIIIYKSDYLPSNYSPRPRSFYVIQKYI